MEPNSQPQTPAEEPEVNPTPQQGAGAMEQSFNEDNFSQPETSPESASSAPPSTTPTEPMSPTFSEPKVAATSPLPSDQTVVTPTTPNETAAQMTAVTSGAPKTKPWVWITLTVVILVAVGTVVYVYMMG